MNAKAMRLKANMRALAKKNHMSAQVVLQNYMFERFLERLSKSVFRDRFIVKGGMLIAALVDMSNRSTMDLDVTLKNYPMDPDALTEAVREICKIEMPDDVTFAFEDIEAIRDDDPYGGYRASIRATYDTIITPMKIDITTGDAITPMEVRFQLSMKFSEGTIDLWAYNIETVIAEKVETILIRGELNTRPRDFYDVYILTKTQRYDPSVVAKALKATAAHRGTSHIFAAISRRAEEIKASEILKSRWMTYSKNYPYANDIMYADVVDALIVLMNQMEIV